MLGKGELMIPPASEAALGCSPGGAGCCVLGSEHAQWGARTLETWALPGERMQRGVLSP